MTWSESRSRTRIQGFLKTVPPVDDLATLAQQRRLIVEGRARGTLDALSTRKAFVVEGAHLYGQLLDFDGVVADTAGGETEFSQRRALEFLNMHYQLWDAVVDDEDVNRVDFHGARMHAVATQPTGDARGQVQKAVALAVRLAEASQRVANAFGFPSRIRFGIDQGRCIAMTTGRSHETDTLFLGAAANYAAKLAASADEEGIFLTFAAQSAVGGQSLTKDSKGRTTFDRAFVEEAIARNPFATVDQAAHRIIANMQHGPTFIFFRPQSPLSSLRFSELVPSHSARRGMASLFADIDGYTAFVDAAVSSGTGAIQQAVTNIHVIREELNAVLKDDFEGKRVRFIGDCIQGVLAEGTTDEPSKTVDAAVLCASGMRSSFVLCQKMLSGMDALDLAIGIEYGPVPLTRIGQRGEDSVRCAAGRAVVVAERIQQAIPGGGVRLGPSATAIATSVVRKLYESSARIPTYDAAADMLGSMASPAVARVRNDPTARPYFENRD
jgi:class 3 adenylate cyclase